MKKILFALLLSAALEPALAAVKAPAKKDPVVMTIDGRDVRRSEFEYFYNKNAQDSAEARDFDKYIELFVNYKLKVAEAYHQGVDTTTQYKNELAGYRKQLAEPYMQVQGWMDTLMAELDANRRREVNASHILVRCEAEASKATSDSCEAVIRDYQRQVEAGADFDSLARAKSEDPSAQQNAGNLGFFAPLQMVYSFEHAAFSTPVGKTAVVRSRFGWHLLKVLGERKTEGERIVGHIMKAFRGRDAESREAAKHQIDSIYAVLKQGGNWDEVCASTSDDQYTAAKGGMYSWMPRTANFPEAWMAAAWSVAEEGAYTEPFATDFGYHIVRVTGIRDTHVMTPEEEQQLRQQFEKDPERQAAQRQAYIAQVRRELAADKKLRKTSVNWSDDEVMTWADSQLEGRYPEFAHIYREYHDGLMLFDVSSKAVWDKAAKDSIGQERFFNEHRAQYRFEMPKFKGAFVECADDSLLIKALTTIYDNEKDINRAADMVRNTVMNDTLLTPNPAKPRFHIVNGLFSKGDNTYVDANRLGVSVQFTPKKAMPFATSYGVLLNEPENVQDVRNQVIADYQAELEKAWVAELRNRYTVKYVTKELDKLR